MMSISGASTTGASGPSASRSHVIVEGEQTSGVGQFVSSVHGAPAFGAGE